MMEAAPALTKSLAAFKSGYIYGITIKPSFARISVALIVSQLSGSRYLESCIISILTKSPQPISRARRAMRTASSAFLAPDVFGSSVTPSGIQSRIFSLSLVLARLTASVIICAPASDTAARIKSRLYLPEPKIKREEKVCPPNVNVSFSIIIFLRFRAV